VLGYLLSDDLIFTSRITGTAQSLGHEVRPARNVAQLANLIIQQVPQCVLVDLHNPGLSIGDLLKQLSLPRPFVVGYGSHVDAATLKAARDAGCDLVLPRSKFVEELPGALSSWLAGAQRIQPDAAV
jgi:DNA-binding NarL/FixJ family response regulator